MRPPAVAITGGIGAGKSELLKAFARHGAAFRAKAYETGWAGIIGKSPVHGPKLREFFSK